MSTADPGPGDGLREAGGFAPAIVAEVALTPPATPVLSAYVRTDPRDPATRTTSPAGRSSCATACGRSATVSIGDGPREARVAHHGLRTAVEAEVVGLEPSERARGVAWFRAVDGAIDRRLRLHLPEAAWRAEADGVAQAAENARAGRSGAIGLAEVTDALAHHRVAHLVFDSLGAFDPAGIPPAARAALGEPPAGMVAERAVELAVASGADVTAHGGTGSERLEEAGGMVAALRF